MFKIVQFETHNTCTRKCWFCKFGQERQDSETTFMPDEIIEKIADELGKMDFRGRISPYRINEPLLDSRIVDIVKLLRYKCPNAFLSFNTNGDKLTEDVFNQLTEAGLDCLGVSIYDDLAYSRLRKFEDLGAVLIDMKNPNNKIENRGGNIKINAESFPDTIYRSKSCERPFNMLSIMANGDVVLCCSDLYGDVVAGNVMDDFLENIWESDIFKHYRDELMTNSRHNLELCNKCSYEGKASSVYYPLAAK